MTDHCDQECERDGDASSPGDSVSLLPDNTRLNEQTVEEISAFGLQRSSKEEKNKISLNQLKPSDPGNGSCTPFSTGCAESSSQSVLPRLPRNLNKRNRKGKTILHLACKRKDLAKVKAVIQAAVDVNAEDYTGWTALHEACVSGHVAVVKELLKAGANVNARKVDGDTPLHDAVCCGHYEVVECLLQCGSNPTDRNGGGLCALDMAKEETIKELLSAFQPPAEIRESNCDKSSNYQSSVRPSTSDTANVGSRESGARAGEPGDIHWRKEDTITDKLCSSKDLAVVLGKVDTNQTELSLLGPENAGRYHTLLIQTHSLLAEVLTKQHQEKDDLTQKCQSVSGSLCQSLSSQLSSLMSRQKDLVRLLHRQTELVEVYVTMKNQREQSHTPVTQAGLGGLRGSTTPGTSPTQVNKASIQTDRKKKDSRPPQDAPQPANMSQVTFKDKPLSQYLLNTDTEDNTAHTHSVEELQRSNTSSTQTPVADSLNWPMKIEIIHLVHDDELLPNALMDVYWKKLLEKTGRIHLCRWHHRPPGTVLHHRPGVRQRHPPK